MIFFILALFEVADSKIKFQRNSKLYYNFVKINQKETPHKKENTYDTLNVMRNFTILKSLIWIYK